LFEIKKEEERRQKECEEQQRKEKMECLKNAQKYWNEAREKPTHEDHTAYLQHKKVKSYQVKFEVDPKEKMSLVIPIKNVDGELLNQNNPNNHPMQTIHASFNQSISKLAILVNGRIER